MGVQKLVFLALVAIDLASGRFTSRVRVPAKDQPLTRDWPCPSNVDIDPCVCESDVYFNLYINCSDVIDQFELARVFQATFPFHDFLQLTIEQDPTDLNRNIRVLQENVFGDVTFERIRISGTKMSEVHEHALEPSHDTLQYLNLANNQLNDFPFETIPSFKKLDSLLLDYNNFTTLYKIDSQSLTTLSVSGNPKLLISDDVFTLAPSLVSIFMAHIDLFELPMGLFSTLTNIRTISLESNFLRTLVEGAFNPVNNTIKQLIINGNLLDTVIHDAIHGMHPDGFISLVRNNLKMLEADVWQPVFDRVINGTINLTGNPLVCGCDIAWIMLDADNRYLPIITETTTCSDGTVVHSLDKQYFVDHCAEDSIDSFVL